ncbi:MAG TPA: hypothetical protein VK211_24540 [Kamptonema sp.]|nr:hypothetical protein [Kamptonema sp.]
MTVLSSKLRGDSKRSFFKRRRYNKPVTFWNPQERLVERIARETGLGVEEVRAQLQKEWRENWKKENLVSN